MRRSVHVRPAGPPPVPVGDITAAMTVEYVDTAGVRQTTPVVDGVTTITGEAPFLVHFDATATRSVIATNEAAAFNDIGYRLNYGESIGGVWDYPVGQGASRDEDTGPPICHRAFTTEGTHNVRLRCRDSGGNESTISMNVVVNPPANVVHIPESAGSWPVFASGTRYTLDAGGAYTGFGELITTGLHNIAFVKTGVGNDPVIGNFLPDARNNVTGEMTRARHIRLWNVDTTQLQERGVGFDYCGVVGGRCRAFNSAPKAFNYDNTSGDRDNIRISRGIYFWDCGEMNEVNSSSYYVFIGSARCLHWRNCDIHKIVVRAEGSPEHIIRMQSCAKSTIVSSLLRSSVDPYQSMLRILGVGSGSTTTDPSPRVVEWFDDDRMGLANGEKYNRPSWDSFAYGCQFGTTIDAMPNGLGNSGAQNSLTQEGYEYALNCGIEDSVWAKAGTLANINQNYELGGINQFFRGNRKDMGAGAYVTSTNNANSGAYLDYITPSYLQQDANTRPVPTAF